VANRSDDDASILEQIKALWATLDKDGRYRLTAEIVRELLHYDPLTGLFVWKQRDRKWFTTDLQQKLWNARRAGKQAFASTNCRGYCPGSILGVPIYAHRVAFLYMTGRWPDPEADHENCIRNDNRWLNLREATSAQNKGNQKPASRNTSGLKGVGWHKARRKWRAVIIIGSKHVHLGLFDSAAEAFWTYVEAARAHFGEFARFD
jgi:hypothetical protein